MIYRKAHVLIAASLLALSVWCMFGASGDFGFLRLDDQDYTFRCAFVMDGLSWANVREAFANVRHGGIWMPVTYISYMTGISMFGPGPGAHHLVNVAIHTVNAVLLLCLVHALARRGALVAELLLVAFWALHPQRAEAVAWIASRKELLCAMFSLGGLLFWIRARSREAGVAPALAGTYACFALACMSKPTAMCFPFLVLAVEGIMRFRRSRFLLVNLSVFLLMSAAVGALAVYSQTHPEGFASRELFTASLMWRLLNAAVSTGLYLFQMVVPVGIHLDYRAVPGGWPLHGALGLCALLVAAAGVAVALWRLRERRGLELSSCLWFAAALAPTLGIFGSFGEHARADRFLYLPAMAVPVALAIVFAQLRGWRMKAALSAVALSVAVAVVASRPVVASYISDEAAFGRSAECDPDHWRALAHVGESRCAAGDLEEGIALLRRSRAALPRDATDAKLAYALMRRGRADDWREIREVCAAIADDPSRDARGQALEALGTAELSACRWDAAARLLDLSIRAPARHYSSSDAILKLAYAYQNGGRRDEARKLFEWVELRSGRKDLAARARQALDVLESAPQGILFW